MAKSCLWRHFFGPPRTLFLITAVHFGCVISHAGSHRHQHGEHTEPRLGAYAGAAAAADSHPRPLDAAQGQADARPALTAAARLHRHRRRHRRVLRGFQRGESKQRSVIVNLSSTDCRLAERSCTPAWGHFYPRDALLARVLAMALCPCLSVCHKSVFYQKG